jgi:hypothetical protein
MGIAKGDLLSISFAGENWGKILMPTYAKDTTVPIDRSKSEIERTLTRYGAQEFMYGWKARQAVIAFKVKDRAYRINLPLPDRNDPQFYMTDNGRRRTSQDAVYSAWEQATRQRWRALALWIKAVLEADEAGIVTLEDALLSKQMLPNGATVGEWLGPQIDEVYRTRQMPQLLPGAKLDNEIDGEVINSERDSKHGEN